MKERLIAAFVGLLVVLPALVFGGPVALKVLVGLVLLIGIEEYSSMAFPDRKRGALLAMAAVLLPAYLALILASGALPAVITLGGIFLLLVVLFRPDPVEGALDHAARLALGPLWIGLASFLALLRDLDGGLAWIFFVLAVTWMGDTGGYFAGRFFGKHKLYEKISPKKTWEGAVGGLLGSIAAAFAVRAVGLPELPALHCLALALIMNPLGVVGDLVESQIKRATGVKDSGWIMPGHGGILDRIDALLFTGPALYLYLVHVLGR